MRSALELAAFRKRVLERGERLLAYGQPLRRPPRELPLAAPPPPPTARPLRRRSSDDGSRLLRMQRAVSLLADRLSCVCHPQFTLLAARRRLRTMAAAASAQPPLSTAAAGDDDDDVIFTGEVPGDTERAEAAAKRRRVENTFSAARRAPTAAYDGVGFKLIRAASLSEADNRGTLSLNDLFATAEPARWCVRGVQRTRATRLRRQRSCRRARQAAGGAVLAGSGPRPPAGAPAFAAPVCCCQCVWRRCAA